MLVKKINLVENDNHATLTTYIIDDSPELLKGQKRPAIIICPGGGYFNCSDREGEPIALKLNSMGYHAFVLRYNVYLEAEDDYQLIHQQSKLTIKERTQFPQQMHDIARSMLLIHQQADEWFVDTERIGICGFSAGGHNVLSYGVHWHQPLIQDAFNNPGDLLRPAVVITGYPISDYFEMRDDVTLKTPEGRTFFNKSCTVLFGTEEPDNETLLLASPARLVNQHTPPMFLWSTFEDQPVPIQQTTLMANALAKEGIAFSCHIFEEGLHGLSVSTQLSANAQSMINFNVAKWMDLLDRWLLKRFALKLPAKNDYEK